MRKRGIAERVVGFGMVLLASLPSGWAQEVSEALSPEAQRLVRLLDAEDSYIRRTAFLQLEALREPATVPVIRGHLSSRRSDTRAFSLRALAAVEGPKAVATLIEKLKGDHSPYVRLEAILALEPFREQDPSVAPALIGALRDRHPEVRMAAVDAVSRIDQSDAKEAILTRWKRERHRDVRRVLAAAMKRLGS